MLSAIGLLAIFVYQMLLYDVIQNGGTYPSGGILIVSLILLIFGAVFGFYGARMLHSHLGLLVPVASTIILFTFFSQWEWCLHYCVHP